MGHLHESLGPSAMQLSSLRLIYKALLARKTQFAASLFLAAASAGWINQWLYHTQERASEACHE
jgi:hypothetical protein